MEVILDPTTVHFHLPNHLLVRVHREYDKFIEELTSYFPHEKDGILKFYGECWKIFNALNSLELKSLEEPLYLFGQFFQKPLECLTIAYYLLQNAGAIARKYIQDPQLLSFIDAEVGTPKTHRRYLARDEGTYGPMPCSIPKGLLGMPFNTTSIDGLYCVGDRVFPGQCVIAVAFSGVMCAHQVAADIDKELVSD
ncbi:prolycopene isomerase, chloroplastic-like [Trifolium pratense]|uniref:prolycopene isomerase, chloroplastic-like n=1 Tax=Trifolium pratense TaxID=57577 RepID=UPI001E693B23|nr:prolycopene isomerase, chloroplastic-like [Trifolium pratense]